LAKRSGNAKTNENRAHLRRVLRRSWCGAVGSIGAFLAAPVAAVSLWLLLTDAVLAGEVTDRDSLIPVARTLVVAFGKAIAAVLAYL